MKRLPSHVAAERATSRRGMTLIEVLLALAIFLLSVSALAQLMSNGMDGAVQSRLKTQAVMRCESMLSEILVVSDLMQTSLDTPFEDDPSWTWSLEVLPGPTDDLLELNVTVQHEGESALSRVSTSLRRYVRDPQIYLDAQLAAAEAEAEEEDEEDEEL